MENLKEYCERLNQLHDDLIKVMDKLDLETSIMWARRLELEHTDIEEAYDDETTDLTFKIDDNHLQEYNISMCLSRIDDAIDYIKLYNE